MKKENVDLLIFQLKNMLDCLGWDIESAKRTLEDIENKVIDNNNKINDIDYFIKRLIADNLYTDEMKDFLDKYMKFYNNIRRC